MQLNMAVLDLLSVTGKNAAAVIEAVMRNQPSFKRRFPFLSVLILLAN
jgi:hypothetical protein